MDRCLLMQDIVADAILPCPVDQFTTALNCPSIILERIIVDIAARDQQVFVAVLLFDPVPGDIINLSACCTRVDIDVQIDLADQMLAGLHPRQKPLGKVGIGRRATAQQSAIDIGIIVKGR